MSEAIFSEDVIITEYSMLWISAIQRYKFYTKQKNVRKVGRFLTSVERKEDFCGADRVHIKIEETNKLLKNDCREGNIDYYFYTFENDEKTLADFKEAVIDQHNLRVAERQADLGLAMCALELAKAALK